jgi:hypothetical protein
MKLKTTILRCVGYLLFGCGAIFAIFSLGRGFSEDSIPKEVAAVESRTAEVMTSLDSAGLNDTQQSGVAVAVRKLVVAAQSNQHFLLVSFFFLSSCIAALLGQIMTLWAKAMELTGANSQQSHAEATLESVSSAASEASDA